MLRLIDRVGQYLVYLGIPGVFLLALLDSAAVPMVGGPDAVVLLLSWHNPAQVPLIVLAAALGSTVGCIVLYRVGMAGGKAALARFSPGRRERIERLIQRNAAWAVFTGVAMPPPFPTKAVILAAGAFRTPIATFAAAVALARVMRYALIGWLGARFGDEAAGMIRDHYLLIVGVLLALAASFILARRLRARGALPPPKPQAQGAPPPDQPLG